MFGLLYAEALALDTHAASVFAYIMGRSHADGWGVPHDDAQAVSYYRKAAECGHRRGQLELGRLLASGRGGPASISTWDCLMCPDPWDLAQDDTKWLYWYHQAAKLGLAEAQYELGRCYLEFAEALEDSPDEDKCRQEGWFWYREAAKQGHAEAREWVGRDVEAVTTHAVAPRRSEQCAQSPEVVLESDHPAGERPPKGNSRSVLGVLYAQGARIGLADAALACRYALGLAYLNGWGVSRDVDEGVSRVLSAAEGGYAMAQNTLGACYMDGVGVAADAETAVLWFRRAAEQGVASAQANLAARYEDGRGVRQSDANAVFWFREAAERGLAEAQYALGFMYWEGRGLDRDAVEAAKWTRRAARQGYAYAQFNLGITYDEGRGVVKDAAEAAAWYRRAAEQGHREAQSALAGMYLQGRGVAQDSDEALRWYRKAGELREAQLVESPRGPSP